MPSDETKSQAKTEKSAKSKAASKKGAKAAEEGVGSPSAKSKADDGKKEASEEV